MINLAVFASGKGSNTENIIRFFSGHTRIRVACVVADRPDAPVLETARNAGIPVRCFTRDEFRQATPVMNWLNSLQVGWIVLAGFLSLLPGAMIHAFRDRIVNIHPALLPAFGGKGMYGMNVHEAVIRSGTHESGITIHFVNERYDEGRIIFQEKIAVDPGETAESLMQKVRTLELRHYPQVLESLIR